MKKIFTFAALLSVVFLAFACAPKPQLTFPENILAEVDSLATPNTLTDAEQAAGWVLLFDGTNTDNFRGYNMTEFPTYCWAVEDNCLTMNTQDRQESQDIITKDQYKNFAFAVQFKLTPRANSGIIFQVKEDTIYQFPYETGAEFQVTDTESNGTYDNDKQICGANYEMYAPLDRNYKPAGDWNQAVLIVKDNKVYQYLNGTLRATYEKYSDEWTALRNSGKWANFPDYGKFDEGHISLQNHGTKVWYRSPKIKNLQ